MRIIVTWALLLFSVAVVSPVIASTIPTASASASAGSCSNSGVYSLGIATAACSYGTGLGDTTANASATNSGQLVDFVVSQSSQFSGSQSGSAQGTASSQVNDVLKVYGSKVAALRIIPASGLSGDFFYTCAGNGAFGVCGYDFSVTVNATVNGHPFQYGECCGVDSEEVTPRDPQNSGTYTLTSSGAGYWSVAITPGSPVTFSYGLTVSADVNCADVGCPIGGDATITGNFADPPVIVAVDANGNPVAGAQIISADGIDYSGVSTAPEPTALSALGLVLITAGVAYCRNRTTKRRLYSPL